MCNNVFALLLLFIGCTVALSAALQQDYDEAHPASSYHGDRSFSKRQLRQPYFPDNVNLGTVTLRDVDKFLASRFAVLDLVHCFKNKLACKTKGEYNFARQIKRLGRRGSCHRCTPVEQVNIRNVMRRTIFAMQKYYPHEWSSLVPHIRNLL